MFLVTGPWCCWYKLVGSVDGMVDDSGVLIAMLEVDVWLFPTGV